MAAMGKVVVLVASQQSGSGMDVRRIRELQCAATRSNGMMGAIGAGLDAWQKVLQGWDRCRSAVDGALWVV